MQGHQKSQKTVAMISVGIVGVCTAIALADRGYVVTLIDAVEPGSHTSRWNAGVMATSSVISLNNPGLFRKLPALMTGRHPGFHLNMRSLSSSLPWSISFLRNALPGASVRATQALTKLISHSRSCHADLSARVDTDPWQTGGWLINYRGAGGYQRAQVHARALQKASVEVELLTCDSLQRLEPAFRPIFGGGVHVTDARFTDPVMLIRAYLGLACVQGVPVLQDRLIAVVPEKGGLSVVRSEHCRSGLRRVDPAAVGQFRSTSSADCGDWVHSEICRTLHPVLVCF